jgi:hypothetical protein
MMDQLVGWLQVVLGALSWMVPNPWRRDAGSRRKRRTVLFTHTKLGPFERTRLKITDDSQL